MKRLAERLLEWILHPDWVDDITGDLDEIYERNRSRSHRYANYKYVTQALLLLRPSLIRPFNLISNNNYDMFKNYLKISSRSLLRHKSSTAINVFGLAIGLAVFLLINQYVRFERSYDTFFSNSDNLYRLTTTAIVNGLPEEKDAMAPHSAGLELHKAIPEITNFTTTLKFDPGMVFRLGEKTRIEDRVITADSNFLQLFTYETLAGNPETMLSEPNMLVMTKSRAEEYFGTANDALGKSIEILNQFDEPFIVSGVIEDIPVNTHYKFDMIISDASIADRFDYAKWNYNNYYSYLIIDPGANLDEVQDKIMVEYKKYYKDNSDMWEVGLVKDIHLKSDFTFEPDINGSEKAINFLNYVSWLILFIAWVNYINLSTARAMNRAKEVGLRKVVGAFRRQLIWQFLTEALIVNFVAAILAVMIAQLLLPMFSQLVGKPVLENVWLEPSFGLAVFTFFLIGTFISGFYPALVLSKYKPTEVLKGKFQNSRNGIVLRKGLVIIQFAASIILVAGTLTIQKQVRFMINKDVGINTDQVVTLMIPEVVDEETARRSDAFKERLLDHSSILTIGRTSNVPGGESADINSTTDEIFMEGFTEPVRGTTYMQFIDDNFIESVEMDMLFGRNFDRNRASDSSALIVNQAFIAQYGIPTEDALGKNLNFGGGENNYQIIGIVRNFNRTSFKTAVEPTIYIPSLYNSNYLLKLQPEGIEASLLYMEEVWDEFYPEVPLDYAFLDDRFAALYQEDQRFGSIFLYFSIFSIFIALLGLFGLASFISAQRTKEVGIRKALGASATGILGMFIREFLILIGIAALIGIPLIYLSMNSWLNNYAFRIEFPWELGAIGVLVVGICAVTTVVFQVYQAAQTEPADALKYE